LNEGILIFLTGQEEIDSTCKTIKQIIASGTESLEPIIVLPLYANMTTVKQMLVFKQTSESKLIVHYQGIHSTVRGRSLEKQENL
jgi:HrpA-like RNA helicase